MNDTDSEAVLIYRATPLSSSLPAPAELLNGNRYSALLPTSSLIQNAHRQIVRQWMIYNKERSAKHYKKLARHLPLPPMKQKVYVQVDPKENQWTPAIISQTPTATQPRSYTVETKDEAHYQQNRRII